jgi:hypothetical protein
MDQVSKKQILKKKYKAWCGFFKYKNSIKIVLLISLHVFLNLITHLWNLWELDLYFKNTKKIILFFSILKIMNLYIKSTHDIKRKKYKKYILILEWLDLNLIR